MSQNILEVTFVHAAQVPGPTSGGLATLSSVRVVEGYTLTVEKVDKVPVGIRITKKHAIGDGDKRIEVLSHRIVPWANIKSYGFVEAQDQAAAEERWRDQFRPQ